MSLVRGKGLSRGEGFVVSHQSAAVLWGLPSIGPWPDDVHFLTRRSSGGRSYPGVRKHALGFSAHDIAVLDGVKVTTAARTAVDLAASLPLIAAVAAVDRVLFVDPTGRVDPLATRAELLATWQRMLPFPGSVRARAVIEFGTHLAGSVLESGSRVNMAICGFPEPELQHPFIIGGRTVRPDFFWPDYSAIGEADGRVKYMDERMLAGRTPADAVIDEKNREDALRRQVRAFTRWDYAVGMDAQRLRARLLGLGLPLVAPGQARWSSLSPLARTRP